MSPARVMAKRKRSEHYVNNKEFLAALIRYREDIEIAEMTICKTVFVFWQGTSEQNRLDIKS